MKYDFSTMPDRRGKDAIAWDSIGSPDAPAGPKEGFDAIPMWVADMNFATCPTIQEAIIRRTQHPAFGYYKISDEYYNAIIHWQTRQNGITGLKKKHIGYENGVLGGVISTLNVLCSRGDNVLVQSPTYIGFTHVLENNGYRIIHNPLIRDENGIWRLDYEDLERKIAENHIHATIFCNPHNPCGRVWEPDEIRKAMAIFEKYRVWVVSDEIWSDILLDGHRHTPTQTVCDYAREHTAAFYAPSKTFNLAGLVGSYHIIYNDWLRERQRKEASLSAYNEMNVLSMHALIGAYTPEGEIWVSELREALSSIWERPRKTIRKLVRIIQMGLNLASHETMTAVKPRPSTMVVVSVWFVPPTSSRPARPQIAPDSSMVRMMTFSTLMPTYLAVRSLSPTTAIS